MQTVRLTAAQAIVRWLAAQRSLVDGEEVPLFPGVFAIFGHGNVTALGEALAAAGDALPTWRGQHEASMGMAGVAFAKARRRRQIMVATSSIGPGATNLVTPAGIAHADRLPLLILSGETFASRIPDPVLQQVEHFDDPTRTVNNAFRAVTRYWDRITRPEQVVQSLPQAVATMLDPADCGPAFLGLSQDAQAEAFDYPEGFFAPRVWRVRRPPPDDRDLADAAELLSRAERPLIVAGGGVHYSRAEETLTAVAARRGVPVVETVAGRACLVWDHPNYAGPLGVTGSSAANSLAAEADVVLAAGTRLQDFTTGSWTVFANSDLRIIGLNTARFDAHKHRALPLIADARVGLEALDGALGDWRAPEGWLARAREEMAAWNRQVEQATAATRTRTPSYAQVIGAVNEACEDEDYVLTAAGGLPGELNMNWRSRAVGAFDCEYGFSCMGYEVGGAWGAAMALPDRDVVSFVGDGSWLMLSSEVFSTVLTGHKVIYVLCDNGGYAVIDRLQREKGSPPFNNMLDTSRRALDARVDFVQHAAAMGANAERVNDLEGLPKAFRRAKDADRTSVLVVRTDPEAWSEGGAWWEVGVPEVSQRPEVQAARADHEAAKRAQRVGI